MAEAWHIFCEMMRRNGDTRTDKEILQSPQKFVAYTKEQADKLIRKIEDDCEPYSVMDDDGNLVAITKKELVKSIKYQTMHDKVKQS